MVGAPFPRARKKKGGGKKNVAMTNKTLSPFLQFSKPPPMKSRNTGLPAGSTRGKKKRKEREGGVRKG